MILLGAFALVELGLAAWVVLLGSQGGSCPLADHGFSCAAVLRPRLSQLGPVPLAFLAVGGGLASLAFTQLAALRPLSAPLARWGPGVLAAGAGFALGVQAWSYAGVGALCPYCLGISLSALGAAGAAAAVAWGERREPPWRAALALALALLVTAPLAWLQGSRLAAEDVARRAAVLELEGPRPALLLVVKPGCAYCEAMLVDTLGDPRVLARLSGSRGVELVAPGDPRLAQVELAGTPTLVCPGSRVTPLAGVTPVEATLAWLERVEAAAR
ncbi:MAG: hypothetical protein KDD82_18770 [Planctomycetes bacterium]|nr:hypothetical protein [Planctomycetota bacterium]